MSIIKVRLNTFGTEEKFLQVRTLEEYTYVHVRVNVDYEGNKRYKLYTIGFTTREPSETMANPAILHCDNLVKTKSLAAWIDDYLTEEAYAAILNRDRLVVHDLNQAIRKHVDTNNIVIDMNISKPTTNLK